MKTTLELDSALLSEAKAVQEEIDAEEIQRAVHPRRS